MFGVVVPLSDAEIAMMNYARENRSLPPLGINEIKDKKRKLGEFIIVDNGSSEQKLEVALRLIESNKFQLVIIDSLASLLTEVADETDLQDEPQQSSEARLITRFCNKYWGKARKSCQKGDEANWTTVLATYQVRANRSMAMYKKSWTVGGAHALRHAKAIDIHMDKGEREPPDRNKPQIGKKIKWEIAKGKAGCHEGTKGEIVHLFNHGFDLARDCVRVAFHLGVLQKENRQIVWEGKADCTFSSEEEAVVRVREDQNLFSKLYKDSIQKAGIECIYKLQ
jgi:hypothetical protein